MRNGKATFEYQLRCGKESGLVEETELEGITKKE